MDSKHTDDTESKFYKILRNDSTHHGFVYQLGLNIDTVPFDPSGSCKPGGLYYTTAEHLAKYFSFGHQIADVEIPVDAKVYQDPGLQNSARKFKADRLIITQITPIRLHPLLSDEAFCLKLVDLYPHCIQHVPQPTDAVKLTAVKRSGYALQYIDEQTNEICLAAVRQTGKALRYVKKQTMLMCIIAIPTQGCFQFVRKQTPSLCAMACHIDGYNIQCVEAQTEPLCINAVLTTPYALQYVQNQTKTVCLIACQKNAHAINYIESSKMRKFIRAKLNIGDSTV